MFFYFNPLKSGVHLQWKLEVDSVVKDEQMRLIQDLQDFIHQRPTTITEFDETLVKHLIMKITSSRITSPSTLSPESPSILPHKKRLLTADTLVGSEEPWSVYETGMKFVDKRCSSCFGVLTPVSSPNFSSFISHAIFLPRYRII